MDNFKYRDGAGEHAVNGVRAVALSISGLACAFSKDWQMAFTDGIGPPDPNPIILGKLGF